VSGKPYAEVIGDPIAHSKSPLIQNFWLKTLGIEADYRACHVRTDDLPDYFAQRRGDAEWRGCNVTTPHKVAALQFADDVDASVSEIGATNCLFARGDSLQATNTDCAGVVGAIGTFDPPFCLIGNGGAARAAFAALDPVRAEQLRLLVRNEAAGHRMIKSMAPLEGSVFGFDRINECIEGCNGLINATSLGMVGQSPMPVAVLDAIPTLAPAALVFDMVYAPLRTELLGRSEAAGFRCIDGLAMLIGQAAAAFEKFFGHPAPREHDAELRALLTS
jgi:shikimate dehydrogenase